MRDFLMFTTQYGVVSLLLKEIPYKQTAYIRIREVREEFFGEDLAECVAFCRMCGAEAVYAAGHEKLEKYPLYTAVVQMRGIARVEQEKVKCLFPVTEKTVSRWRSIYNERMAAVDNTATLESRDEEKILSSGGAYFIHDAGSLLGIGWLEDEKLLAVAAVEKGAGEAVMHTLLSIREGLSVTLEVASTNERAMGLYEKLGFVKTAELDRWYDVSDVRRSGEGETEC